MPATSFVGLVDGTCMMMRECDPLVCSLMSESCIARFDKYENILTQCLRAAHRKPVESRANFISYVRNEFRKHLHIEKRDYVTIEYLLRQGGPVDCSSNHRTQKARCIFQYINPSNSIDSHL